MGRHDRSDRWRCVAVPLREPHRAFPGEVMNAAQDNVDFSLYVRPAENGAATMDLAIAGVDCAACLDDIEGSMRSCAGVVSARLNLTTHRLRLVWSPVETNAAV